METAPILGVRVTALRYARRRGRGHIAEIGVAPADALARSRKAEFLSSWGPSPLVNDVGVFERDLTKAIAKPGTHKVWYEGGKVVSNEIEIEVRETAK